MNDDTFFLHVTDPIELPPGPGFTRAGSFQHFYAYVQKLGGDPRAILLDHGVDPMRIHDPEYHVVSRAMVEIFQHCAAALNAPLFGLHLAALQSPEAFGCVAALCRSAPNLRVAMQNFVDYLPVVHSPEYDLALREINGVLELRWFGHSEAYEAYEQVNHHALMRIVKFFLSLAPKYGSIAYAHISTDAIPAHRTEIVQMLGCDVGFDQHIDCIGIAASNCDHPLPSSDRVVHHLLNNYLKKVKAAQHLSLAQRVEAYVQATLDSHSDCNIDRCAKKMGMSTRTLQHQLRRANVSFSEIVVRHRMDLAKVHLLNNHLSISEIALMLGYAEQTSFARAFKKWTGTSPSHFKK